MEFDEQLISNLIDQTFKCCDGSQMPSLEEVIERLQEGSFPEDLLEMCK